MTATLPPLLSPPLSLHPLLSSSLPKGRSRSRCTGAEWLGCLHAHPNQSIRLMEKNICLWAAVVISMKSTPFSYNFSLSLSLCPFLYHFFSLYCQSLSLYLFLTLSHFPSSPSLLDFISLCLSIYLYLSLSLSL